jgi:cobalt-zinc-cadmium efflux system protein
VAGVGVVINTATALLFVKGRHADLNIKGAFLHMAADAGISLGVVLAGFGIYATGWTWIDPLSSLAIALIILLGTWGLLRDSMNLALHAVPKAINVDDVKAYLASLEGVERIHDLHIWAMSTTETALTAHLEKPLADNEDSLLARAACELHDRFGIEHVTLQIERDAAQAQCRQVADDSL